MKVTAERVPESQVVLQIEVDPERVERSMDWAYRKLAGRTKVPGFRKGKVPRPMLERYVGREALMQEALDHLVPEVYREAVEQESIDPIDQPDLEVTSLEPVVLKATVPVAPTVELGDFKSIRREPPQAEVDETEVDAMIDELRHRYATLEPRDRPVQDGDTVRCDVRAWADGRQIVGEDDAQFVVRKNGAVSLPGFSDALLGREKGKVHEFTLDVDDQFQEAALAGKTVRYEVDLKEVKEEQLPPLDNGFARTVGEGFDTLKELRARLKDDLLQSKQRQAEDEFASDVLGLLTEQAKIEYPPVLVQREVERLLHERAGHAGDRQALDGYLRQVGRSEEEVAEELRPEATRRLLRSLVLTEVSRAESIEISEEDVDAEIDAMAGSGPQSEQVRRAFAAEAGRDVVRRSLITRRTLERLAAIARGDGVSAAAGTPPATGKSTAAAQQSEAGETAPEGGGQRRTKQRKTTAKKTQP